MNGGCTLDKKWYKPGAQWHPYVVPFGYSKCTVCTCMVRTDFQKFLNGNIIANVIKLSAWNFVGELHSSVLSISSLSGIGSY